MFEQSQISSLKSLVDSAQSVIIALPPDPDTDVVASGLALYLTLSQNKQVQIGSSSPVKVTSARLNGVDQIRTNIGSKNLVISFDYPEDKLDKIDYEKTEDGNIRLLIRPIQGEDAPDPKAIKFTYSGANADLVFVLGVKSLEELGRLYSDEKAFFDSANLVNITNASQPSPFTEHTFANSSATSVAEISALLLKDLNLSLSAEAASNLLTSISESTQGFASPRASADTYEAISYLLRQGGRRPPSLQPGFASTVPPFTPLSPATSPATPPVPTPTPSKVPSDWKEPKIFRSDTPKRTPSSK